MHVPTYLLALHVHGPRFTSPFISIILKFTKLFSCILKDVITIKNVINLTKQIMYWLIGKMVTCFNDLFHLFLQVNLAAEVLY